MWARRTDNPGLAGRNIASVGMRLPSGRRHAALQTEQPRHHENAPYMRAAESAK
jgi:hypothetical protein